MDFVNGAASSLLVAPYAGAWIEIVPAGCPPAGADVAPYAGAWIEIRISRPERMKSGCRSLCGSVD